MARAKRGTLEGDLATERWRETMRKKYGTGYNQMMADIGSIGGKASRTGGFYWMKQNGQEDKISEAGKKGGRISRINGRYLRDENGRVRRDSDGNRMYVREI